MKRHSHNFFSPHCCLVCWSARASMLQVTPKRAASADFLMAKQKELASREVCKVYDLVPDEGPGAISLRWELVDKGLED